MPIAAPPCDEFPSHERAPRARMAGLPHEVVAVMHLGSQLQVISIVEVFPGTVTMSVVYARGDQGGA